MDFIKLETELPPAQTIVMIKRKNGLTYLGYRKDQLLTTNTDPSQDCHWHGNPINDLKVKDADGGFCGRSFSDVTVEGWAYVSAE